MINIIKILLYNLYKYWDIEAQDLHNQLTLSNKSIYKEINFKK